MGHDRCRTAVSHTTYVCRGFSWCLLLPFHSFNRFCSHCRGGRATSSPKSVPNNFYNTMSPQSQLLRISSCGCGGGHGTRDGEREQASCRLRYSVTHTDTHRSSCDSRSGPLYVATYATHAMTSNTVHPHIPLSFVIIRGHTWRSKCASSTADSNCIQQSLRERGHVPAARKLK